MYVFALLAELERDTVNPMELGQWDFYAVSTQVLNERFPLQKSISLSVVRSLASVSAFAELATRVHACRAT